MPLAGFVGTPARIDRIYRDQQIREENESPSERASRIHGLRAEKANFIARTNININFDQALAMVIAAEEAKAAEGGETK